MPDVYFVAEVGVCNQFHIGGKKQDVSIVITPLKVTDKKEGEMKVSYGCNMWKSCENKNCAYSLIAHPAQKIS